MKHKKRLVAIAVSIVISLIGGACAYAEEPIDVGSQKQLFVDDEFFAESQGVTLKIQPPRKTGEIILRPEHPWENAALSWFNVVEDPGRIDKRAKYRMWYAAYDVDGWPTGDDTSFCYAESRDGIHWTKPELGLFSYQGSTLNNVLFRQIGSQAEGNRSRVHGAGVFIDANAPPEARYKGVSQGIFAGLGKPPHRIAGMYSADGLKWTRFGRPICDVFADSQYSGFWDPSRGRYVLYGRVGGRGRSIGRSQSADFSRFDPLKLILQADDQDPPESDLYNAAVLHYPYARNIYLMFPSLYQHGPDTLDIRLAVSRDGVRWSRPDRETPFVELGKGDGFDTGSLYMGQGMIRVGDELWLYYSGSRLRHNEAKLENLTQPHNARLYSRVVAKLDRLIAATGGEGGGSFTTPPLRFAGETLQLNLKVQKGGSVRIGLLDEENRPLAGRSVDDCVPMVGDSLRMPVKWKEGSDLGSRVGEPARLRVEMTRAELFGFQFVARDQGQKLGIQKTR